MIKPGTAKATIISAIELNALEPASKLAKQIKMKEANVRYHLRELVDSGVLGQVKPFIDISRLGYTEYILYCSLIVEARGQKQKITQWLIKQEQVWWVKQLVGEYQLAVSVYAKNIQEVNTILAELDAAYGQIVNDVTFLVRTGYYQFNKQYLSSIKKNRLFFKYGGEQKEVTQLSDSERFVLKGLINESYDSLRSLALKLKIPLSSLLYSKKQLEEKEVVLGYFYQVDSENFNRQRSVIMVSVKGNPAILTEEFVIFCLSITSVTTLAISFGSWQYEIGLEITDQLELSRVIDQLYQKFSDSIASLRVKPVIKLNRKA